MRAFTWIFLALLSSQTVCAAMGKDLDQAFPSFDVKGKKAVPVDFEYVHLDLNFDPSAQTGIGKCSIEFYAREAGYPLFDLVPQIRNVRLNGKELGSGGAETVSSPDGQTKMRMVTTSVAELSKNQLEIEFALSKKEVSYSSDGVRMVWAMADVGGDRAFLERYACSSFEFDHFEMDMKVHISGSPVKHQLFTNGEITKDTTGDWEISFPGYFSTSSFFFHISDKAFAVESEKYTGVEKEIPITVYSTSRSTSQNGMRNAKRVLSELEKTYGPFAHQSLTLYVKESGGGMEHVGAAITSLGALGHEVTHSWFARGVMPADGNSGWIDEAVARWRDRGYPKGSASLSGSSSRLASFSKYRRDTPFAAYADGSALMGRFDALFSTGMKSVLREVFARAKRTSITTPDFQKMVESITGTNVDDYFARYVYGKSLKKSWEPLMPIEIPHYDLGGHPPKLTQQEIEAIR